MGPSTVYRAYTERAAARANESDYYEWENRPEPVHLPTVCFKLEPAADGERTTVYRVVEGTPFPSMDCHFPLTFVLVEAAGAWLAIRHGKAFAREWAGMKAACSVDIVRWALAREQRPS